MTKPFASLLFCIAAGLSGGRFPFTRGSGGAARRL